MNCPLCSSSAVQLFDKDKFRTYRLCSDCRLISVPRNELLSKDEEKARYDLHENDESDQYRTYLSAIAKALLPQILAGSRGLDFGCGKSLMMEKILESHGLEVDSYDIYYHPRETVLEAEYDFILLSEVIEHLAAPLEVMTRLRSKLKPGGKFFLKTKLYPPDLMAFNSWPYKRDPTHIQFFDFTSLKKLGEIIDLPQLKVLGPDIFMLF
jgi:SAM-dependent methyltransferase